MAIIFSYANHPNSLINALYDRSKCWKVTIKLQHLSEKIVFKFFGLNACNFDIEKQSSLQILQTISDTLTNQSNGFCTFSDDWGSGQEYDSCKFIWRICIANTIRIRWFCPSSRY